MTTAAYFTRISLMGIAIALTLTILGTGAYAANPSISQLDIAGGIIEELRNDTLTKDTLTSYFETNSRLLRNNIGQGLARYKKETVAETVAMNFDKYIQNKDRIIANWDNFGKTTGRVSEKISAEFGDDIPGIVLVPCIVLIANGGWADTIDGVHYIFAALEMIPPQLDIGVLLVHEIAHGISDVGWDTLLDGVYNEGYATYVSRALTPGMPESVYFMMSPPKIAACYSWMEANRKKIAEDADKALAVMNDMHKFYLTTSYSEYPNIGYVIGYEYIRHLNERYTLEELRTFAMDVDKNRAAFQDFVLNADFGETAATN